MSIERVQLRGLLILALALLLYLAYQLWSLNPLSTPAPHP